MMMFSSPSPGRIDVGRLELADGEADPPGSPLDGADGEGAPPLGDGDAPPPQAATTTPSVAPTAAIDRSFIRAALHALPRSRDCAAASRRVGQPGPSRRAPPSTTSPG